ncbi:MAG: helix-turn-helix transcriptional regulator, partial [Acutalibacteraceae bacterium]|nr:helix-turn-helix transcriptional regulator [Acutalibacteraceae bacterium]
MSVVGKQIKKYRIEKGITQEQLGQLVGVTTQAVSKWERGGTPDAELLPKLSQVLSVSIDSLFGLGEENLLMLIMHRI